MTGTFDVAADDVGLVHAMGEAVVAAVTLVDPEVLLLFDDDGRLDLNSGSGR